MAEIIYGLSLADNFNARDVKKSLVTCFSEAHAEDSGLGSDKKATRDYCETIVKSAFEKTGGDYENPTKESLIKAMSHLEEFAANFRNPKIVEKHAKQIMRLVDAL